MATSDLGSIRAFLALKRIAIVGVSRGDKETSRMLFREFRARGCEVVPVNPEAAEIEGLRCYGSVKDIQPPVEGALIMTPPEVTRTAVRDCAEAGIKRVWMYRGGTRGAVDAEAIGFCEARGIQVIPGECPFMFLPDTAWFHRLHGFVKRITGTYPRASA